MVCLTPNKLKTTKISQFFSQINSAYSFTRQEKRERWCPWSPTRHQLDRPTHVSCVKEQRQIGNLFSMLFTCNWTLEHGFDVSKLTAPIAYNNRKCEFIRNTKAKNDFIFLPETWQQTLRCVQQCRLWSDCAFPKFEFFNSFVFFSIIIMIILFLLVLCQLQECYQSLLCRLKLFF